MNFANCTSSQQTSPISNNKTTSSEVVFSLRWYSLGWGALGSMGGTPRAFRVKTRSIRIESVRNPEFNKTVFLLSSIDPDKTPDDPYEIRMKSGIEK